MLVIVDLGVAPAADGECSVKPAFDGLMEVQEMLSAMVCAELI